jgi:hypothetical protein
MSRLAQLLLIIALPLVFVTATVRAILATNAFVVFEYNRPGFPADGYGSIPEGSLWDTPERLEYADRTRIWLRDNEPAEVLAALRARDGTVLYRADEVSHLVDVRRLTGGMSTVLLVALAVVVLAGGYLLARPERRPCLAGALRGAGVLTWVVAGVFGLLLAGGLNSGVWDALFTGFHEVFFPWGNWQFYYTDTLIRLFPEQLWFDFAAAVIVTTLLLATLAAVIGVLWRRQIQAKPQMNTDAHGLA